MSRRRVFTPQRDLDWKPPPCYRMITYDVWGNPKDGFEINNMFRTSHVVEIPDETPAGVLTVLKATGLVRREIRPSQVVIEILEGSWDGAGMIEVTWRSTGEPQFRLEQEPCKSGD